MDQICLEINDSNINCFVNPLQVNFGSGCILTQSYKDANGSRGLMMYEINEPLPIGEKQPDLQLKSGHKPQKGELYLTFANIESAKAFRDSLDEVIDGFLGKE